MEEPHHTEVERFQVKIQQKLIDLLLTLQDILQKMLLLQKFLKNV
jgi:hypothetical protein